MRAQGAWHTNGLALKARLVVPMTGCVRLHARLVVLSELPVLTAEQTSILARGMMDEVQRGSFVNANELDFAYSLSGVGRFRVNVFHQRGSVGLTLRRNLYLKGNGAWMGSEIANTGSLALEVYGADPDNEIPTLVQLISFGGQVVTSTRPATSTFTWQPTIAVSAGAHYYYVKMTQADGDRIVSSPIWVTSAPGRE